jgi:hypothetical protein
LKRQEFDSGMKQLCSLLVLLCATSLPAAITGQWDFDNADLSATIGAPLLYRGTTASQTQFGTTTSFGIANINGEVGRVMRFPAASSTQGYYLVHGALPNGGGAKVNQYTVLMDVLFPSSSGGYRALWQTDTNNATDADLFVNGANGLGISSVYEGNLTPDTWHRVAFAIDASTSPATLTKYIDGTLVGTQSLADGVDGRWSLDSMALLFADEDGETGLGYVNSVQFHNRVLTPAEVAALGGPSAAGIPAWSGSGIAQWDFNGNLASSTGGASLSAEAAAPASAAGVAFTSATIGGQTAQVASFTRGTFLRMTHGLQPNGGGSYLNEYTLIMDVMFPSRPIGWAALLQTSPSNANDADWFINSSGGLGISSVYGGTIADGTWNRIALVVDAVAGTFTSYLNGAPVQQISGVTLDGRWALDPAALLFADENQENAAGYVNSVQLRGTALSAAELAALGGPQAAGISLPLVPSGIRVLTPNGGEVFPAGTTQSVTWVATNAAGAVQIDLLLGATVYRSLGQVLMANTNYSWSIDPKLGDTNSYRIRITSVDYPTVQDASDNAFSVTGSGGPPDLVFGQPLQLNGGFEAGLTNWQVVSGHATTLTAADSHGSPYAGSRFLYGGVSPGGNTVVRQDIDLLGAGFTATDLDAGAAVDAQAYLRTAYGLGTFDDQVYLRVACLDGAGQELASVRSLIAGNNSWTLRSAFGVLPPGTRRLRTEVVGLHRRDADNDSMADEVVVRVQRAWPLVSPQITKLPLLQDFRPDAMTLFWETDGNLALHAVDWGRTNISEHTLSQIETIQLDTTHFVHRATLSGLLPETTYVYRVRSGSTVSPTFSFRTAPRRATPFAVAWWADSQENPSVLQQLIPIMLAHGVDWMGISGDLASSGNSLYDWHNYCFKPLETQNIGQTHPMLFSHGNHDTEYPFSYAYSALPGNGSWYAFEYGNSRFIFLDTEAPTSVSPEQYAWLVNELSRPETQQAAFRIVSFHKPLYVNLWNGGGYTGETWVRNDWMPLFQQYNVDAIINGHAHNYNRGLTNGVTCLIVGGGGGALDTERVAQWPLFTVEYSVHHYGLMQVRSNTLSWSAYDTTGQVIDSFTLQSRVPLLAWGGAGAGADSLPLALTGKPGVAYVLECSADLTHWSALSTNTIPVTGQPSVTNTISLTAVRGFFRARATP